MAQCPNGATGETCTFSCNPGYQLYGAQSGICSTDHTWSVGPPLCHLLSCPARIFISNDTYVSLMGSSCTLEYSSHCILYCNDGFVGEDVIYVCNVTSDPTVLSWMPIGGVHAVCERGMPYTKCMKDVNNLQIIIYFCKNNDKMQFSLVSFILKLFTSCT